jgi:tetratricopeptide (TPR) repeat protein
MKRSTQLILSAGLVFFMASCNSADTTKKTETQVVLAASSQSSEARNSFTQGLAMLDQNDTKKARELFIKAIQQDPKLAIAYMFKANTDVTPKEFADDMAKAKENLGTANEWEKLYYDYDATFLNNDWNKRMDLAQKMSTTYANTARAQAELGNTYLSGNQDAKARIAFQKAVELDPTWIGGYIALTNSYLFSEPKDFSKAEQNALKAVELAPNSAGLAIALGDVYRAQNMMEKARDAYAKAIQLDPDAPGGYYKKGHANCFLGNYDEARQNYKDGASHDEQTSAEAPLVVNTYLYAGDYKMALKYLKDEVAKLNSAAPSDKVTSAKVNLLEDCATIAMYTGDSKTLKEVLPGIEAVTTQIGNDVGTAEGKAVAHSDLIYWEGISAALDGNYDGAKIKADEFKTTVQAVTDPSKLVSMEVLLGFVSMKQKNYADAVSHFEKTNPSVTIYNKFWLAAANEMAGNKDRAATLYKEVADYNFNDTGYALVRSAAKTKAGETK